MLPAYHAGARTTLSFTENLSITAAIYNGWNAVVDNNDAKSIYASFNGLWTDVIAFQLLYFAVRGDAFAERTDESTFGSNLSRIFSDAGLLASGTATLELRPADHFSLRTEVRYDYADEPLFFARDRAAPTQLTLTEWIVAWF